MSNQKKKKFTAVDVIIILIVIAAAVFGAVKLLPSLMHPSNMEKITFTVMLSQQEETFADAVREGDRVTISLTEKDGGVIKEVRSEDSTAIAYNSIEGSYANETIPDRKDVYITIEADVKVNDLAIMAGGTPIKVGADIPVRGKGYASSGYVIEIND